MNKHSLHGFLVIGWLVCAQSASAQTTDVDFNSGTTPGQDLLYADVRLSTPLTAGNVNVAGDGAVLQLGYFQNATTSNLFGNGTFVPLSGEGSANTYTHTTIGDDPGAANGAGTFAMGLSFSSAAGSVTGNNLPTSGTPLALRFYNGTTLANSSAYNAVSDAIWAWTAPATPDSVVTMTFDDNAQSPLQWLGGASSAFYTNEPIGSVPEPSTWIMAGLASLLLVQRVFRRFTT